ncbi:MAG: hypothetical protein ACXADW_19030 [Candidatus Hodarchaeales archaeon]|jgi:hypothetical protein
MRKKPFVISCRLDEGKRRSFLSKIKEEGLSTQIAIERLVDFYIHEIGETVNYLGFQENEP